MTESFDRVLFVALQFLSLEGLGWAAGRAGWAGYVAGLAAWAGVLGGAGMGLGSLPTHWEGLWAVGLGYWLGIGLGSLAHI